MEEAAALEAARVAATKASYETDDLMGQYLSLVRLCVCVCIGCEQGGARYKSSGSEK
jgi:hypothetical protein